MKKHKDGGPAFAFASGDVDTASSFQDALVKSSNQLLEYEDKIRTLKNENAELKKQVDSLVANLAAAHEDRNEEAKSVFVAKQVEIPELLRENAALRNEIVRLNNQTMWVCSCGGTDCAGRKENAALRETLAIEQERSLYWRSIAGRKEEQP